MNRLNILMISLASIFLLAILSTQTVWSKAHVPTNKVQVCHVEESASSDLGVALSMNANALGGHLGHGDCQLPACDFNNVFHTGDACGRMAGADGKCEGLNDRIDAGGQTPGCPPGTF
jgi:hypothetical protein